MVGYTGGKDSTAVLQLVWMALAGLPAEQRTKPVHVISTDTLVENPVVAAWVTHSLEVMAGAAAAQGLPITAAPADARRSTDTFWVNLIGRGYPGAAAEVPLVHRAAEDQAVQRVHPRRGPRARRGDPGARHAQGRELRARAPDDTRWKPSASGTC